MHRRPAVVMASMSVAVGAALVVGAVASGSSAPPVSGPDDSTTTVTWPTVPPFFAGPTTTVDPSAPTTTTTLSPAAQTPPVTLVPLGPEQTDVVNALYEGLVVFVETGLNPDASGLDQRIAGTYASESPALLLIEQMRTQLREEGLRAYLNEATPWALTVEDVRFYAEPFPRAEVVGCYLDTLILYEPGGAPDGSDLVLDDYVYSSRLRYVLVIENGVWVSWQTTGLTPRVRGVTSCPAS